MAKLSKGSDAKLKGRMGSQLLKPYEMLGLQPD